MHVLESYALQNDFQIDKPFIYERYFPLAIDKFITIDTSSMGTSAMAYDYWQLVVDIILPYLKERDITIIQLGDKDDQPLKNCYMAIGQCNFNQKAYVVKKSLLNISSNNETSHVASAYGNKQIVLFPNNCHVGQFKPYWSDPENLTVIPTECSSSNNPSFNPNENPKSINSIKPERIASEILVKLGIHGYVSEFKTIKIGSLYSKPKIESNLTNLIDVKKLGVNSLIVRMDLNFNEESLALQLNQCHCSIITNKSFNPQILSQYKSKIVELVYYLEDDNDPNFIQKAKENSINYLVRSRKDTAQTNDFKLQYMDYGLVQQIPQVTQDDIEELKGLKNLYYKSKHFIIHQNSFYPGSAAVKNQKYGASTMEGELNPVIDDPLFWEDRDHFYFLQKK